MRLSDHYECRCHLSCFFFQAEDGIRDLTVTGVQTCALPIYLHRDAGAGLAYREEPAARIESERHRARPDRHGERRLGEAIAGRDDALEAEARRSEERRVGKEGRSRWSPYH